jgi:uncharacterized protein (DUF1697 family)
MARYVALLRGINVGRNKRIAMADLRALLADLGLTDVRTLLNSGNALFSAPEAPTAELAERITAAIAERLGMTVSCVVLTGDELRASIAAHPYADVADNGSRMMVWFCSAAPDPDRAAMRDALALDPERARLVGTVLYQWCPGGLMDAPPVAAGIEDGIVITSRNWNTVTKLAELL